MTCRYPGRAAERRPRKPIEDLLISIGPGRSKSPGAVCMRVGERCRPRCGADPARARRPRLRPERLRPPLPSAAARVRRARKLMPRNGPRRGTPAGSRTATPPAARSRRRARSGSAVAPRRPRFLPAHQATPTRATRSSATSRRCRRSRGSSSYFFVPPLVLAVAMYLVGGWPWLVWGFCLPTMTLAHATFAINTVNHLFGSRRFETLRRVAQQRAHGVLRRRRRLAQQPSPLSARGAQRLLLVGVRSDLVRDPRDGRGRPGVGHAARARAHLRGSARREGAAARAQPCRASSTRCRWRSNSPKSRSRSAEMTGPALSLRCRVSLAALLVLRAGRRRLRAGRRR